MPDTPLNPDAVERTVAEVYGDGPRMDWPSDMNGYQTHRDYARTIVEQIVSAYLAAALPEVTGEQVNFAGWTCNGIHEPGDYSTCNECREACDDLANFYNQMMRNPRPGKHWTGKPALLEVTSVEEVPAKLQIISWEEEPEHECWKLAPDETFVGLIVKSGRSWTPRDKYTLNIERPEVNDA